MRKENIRNIPEGKGLRLLEELFETTERIKTYFTRDDKIPLFDGYFNYLREDRTILKQFDVQIKTTDCLHKIKKGPNNGKYKFEFDIDVLEAVRTKITENPTYYFIIDTTNKKIFYKFLSTDFLIELKYHKSNNKKDFLLS